MANYPAIANPEYPLKEERLDSTLRNDMEGGYEQTRPRFTRIRTKFTLKYAVLSQADKVTLDNFVASVMGAANAFSWTHPTTGTVYTVRFEKPPAFELIVYGWWSTEVVLVTV